MTHSTKKDANAFQHETKYSSRLRGMSRISDLKGIHSRRLFVRLCLAQSLDNGIAHDWQMVGEDIETATRKMSSAVKG